MVRYSEENFVKTKYSSLYRHMLALKALISDKGCLFKNLVSTQNMCHLQCCAPEKCFLSNRRIIFYFTIFLFYRFFTAFKPFSPYFYTAVSPPEKCSLSNGRVTLFWATWDLRPSRELSKIWWHSSSSTFHMKN